MSGTAPSGAIVFSDIVGFTELTDRHGDDVALDLVERHAALVRAALAPSGRIVKELGDGLLLWFDDPVDAVCAALQVQARSGDGIPADTGEHVGDADPLPLWVRIGVHWGSPRRRGDDVIGRDVNLASRVADLAGAGETLCTGHLVDAVVERVRLPATAGIGFEFVGAVFVRGVAEPVPLHRARHAHDDAGGHGGDGGDGGDGGHGGSSTAPAAGG